VPGGVEVGEFGVDVDGDGDGAEQADGVGLGRGYVDEQVEVDAAALSVQVVDSQPEILGRPSRDGVGGQGQTPCLLGLLLQRRRSLHRRCAALTRDVETIGVVVDGGITVGGRRVSADFRVS
jgi:hypothetical protein